MLPLPYLLALASVSIPSAGSVVDQAGLALPETIAVSSEFHPSIAGGAGGRVDVRGRVGAVPLARTVARAWVGKHGTVLVSTTEGAIGPVLGGLEPTLQAGEAIAILAGSGLSGSVGAKTARLVVDAGPSQSRLVWRIDPPVDPQTYDNKVFFVDAHTGTVREAFNRTRSANVRAFEINPVQTPVAEVFELHDVDETAPFLEGQYFRVRNCTLPLENGPCTYAPTLTPDINGDFFYPVPDISIPAKSQARDDAYAEISAYYNADRFQAFLATLGDPGLLCSQGETRTNITVNQHGFVGGAPQWFANAYYTGDCNSTVVMGQAEEVDFAWDGDVVLHELGHGITDRQTGEDGSLGLPRHDEHSAGNDAGAINEGTSDFFASALSGARVHGAYLGPPFSRDLGTDATCPTGLPGEIHDDGILWATALLDVTDELGLDFIAVVIDTLGMLPLDVDFDVAASTLETIARDTMGDSAGDLVAEVMATRGLSECERVAPIEDARFGMWLLPANWDVNFNPVRPPPFQVEFAVPDNATNLTVTFEPFDYTLEGEQPMWSVDVILKADEPIVFSYEELGGLTNVDADSTEQGSFSDDNTWSREVQGGERLYAAFLNRGSATMRMDNITVEYELADTGSSSSGGTTSAETGDDTSTSSSGGQGSTSTSDATAGASTTTADSVDTGTSAADTDAGDPDAVDDDGGCGCRAPNGNAPSAWLWLGLVGLFGRRRRCFAAR